MKRTQPENELCWGTPPTAAWKKTQTLSSFSYILNKLSEVRLKRAYLSWNTQEEKIIQMYRFYAALKFRTLETLSWKHMTTILPFTLQREKVEERGS